MSLTNKRQQGSGNQKLHLNGLWSPIGQRKFVGEWKSMYGLTLCWRIDGRHTSPEPPSVQCLCTQKSSRASFGVFCFPSLINIQESGAVYSHEPVSVLTGEEHCYSSSWGARCHMYLVSMIVRTCFFFFFFTHTHTHTGTSVLLLSPLLPSHTHTHTHTHMLQAHGSLQFLLITSGCSSCSSDHYHHTL